MVAEDYWIAGPHLWRRRIFGLIELGQGFRSLEGPCCKPQLDSWTLAMLVSFSQPILPESYPFQNININSKVINL